MESSQTRTACPHSPGVFQGIRLDIDGARLHGVSVQLPCNSWDCPVCNGKKIAQVRARIFNGSIYESAKKNGYRDKYHQKFLTLTVPGADYRRVKTPEQALEDMNKYFNLLRTAMRKKFGYFAYFRILEKQRDGFPHFHVLLSGENISGKQVLEYIENLWRKVYNMGFVRLNVITKDLQHGIRYATKYLTKKDKVKKDRLNIKRYARLFSASKGALQPMKKKKKYDIFSKVYFGAETPESFTEIEITAHPVSAIVRAACVPVLRYRVLKDEIEAFEILRKKSKMKF